AEGLVGRAFCPTSRAVHHLRRAGAEPLPHPTQEVLREVNGRAFCAALGQTLPGAVFARDLETAKSMVGRMPTVAKQWRAKRAFTMAGRGQRCIVPGPLSEADTAFLRASITSDGGVQIEPSVTIVRELGIHALLEQSGELCLGRIVTQTCDEHGQWRSTSPAENVAAEVSDALTAEARRVARALHGAGYFGPFGIDAFEWEDESGVMRLQPRSEINARYSMGFAVGFGHELCSATGASP
ncbi:MAG TPA: hypothetical protein VM580_34490, partial [Labilithrix sp.]|nr:hypothetical protein [Labilithrix sp.]